MVVSLGGIIGIAAILSAILSWIIVHFSKNINDSKAGIGCFFFCGLTLVIFLTLAWIAPEVIVIDDSEGDLKHKEEHAFFSYNGNAVSIGKKYLFNQSNENLILYPAYYGTFDASIDDPEDDSILIKSNSWQEIEHVPDYYFYLPWSIVSKKKKKIERKWILVRDYGTQNSRSI